MSGKHERMVLLRQKHDGCLQTTALSHMIKLALQEWHMKQTGYTQLVSSAMIMRPVLCV
jgi:hypothetical protein